MKRIFKIKNTRTYNADINPDDIFLDSENIPDFNTFQLEGRIEKPISKKTLWFIGIFFSIVICFFLFRVSILQIQKGADYLALSENNRLNHTLVFSNRGNIYDRNGEPLVWNLPKENEYQFGNRQFIEKEGFANLLGYVKYPQKDKYGFYYEEEFKAFGGIESVYHDMLKGNNGLRIIETDALGEVISENTIRPAEHGKDLNTSIDIDVQETLFRSIKEIAEQVGFSGGGGVIMDVNSGEILALTSYPEFDPNILTDGSDTEKINQYLNDTNNPFLNRVIGGLYTPGSIMKPYVAIGVLNENVIDQFSKIISRGKLEVPNPYNPSEPSIFTDWKAHGPVNVREALAYSSNIYFYVTGGGFGDQKGLGITKMEKYYRDFGFGSYLENDFFRDLEGTIPNPSWKEKIFDGDPWRLGDTYFTAIGQYGTQVTPIQVVRAVSTIANGGKVVEPKMLLEEETKVSKELVNIKKENFQIVRDGMRDAVLFGTAKGLNMESVHIAAKTGTAELGVTKERVNSWVTGFFPYENPKYAFVIVMEKGLRTNLIGGVAVARKLFEWMSIYAPEYLE